MKTAGRKSAASAPTMTTHEQFRLLRELEDRAQTQGQRDVIRQLRRVLRQRGK
jgi:hypothetical protein